MLTVFQNVRVCKIDNIVTLFLAVRLPSFISFILFQVEPAVHVLRRYELYGY